MKTETYFCLVLSESQARFFATSKYGIDRMKALMSLVELASTENRTYEKKGFSANLNVGQLVMSEERVGDCLNDTEQPHQHSYPAVRLCLVYQRADGCQSLLYSDEGSFPRR